MLRVRMLSSLQSLASILAVFVAFGGAAVAEAGEPIPDIDVIIEQNPGGRVSVELHPPAAYEGDPVRDIPVVIYEKRGVFDEVRLGLERKTARSASVSALPRGWTMERDGKALVLRGPALAPPARLSFQVDAEARPDSLDVELLRDGETLKQWRQLVPRQVPPRRMRGTLSGVVRMPDEVAPGEALALRVLDDELPVGTFSLSGVVSEPFTEDELAVARTILNTTRSNIKLQAAILPGPLTLLGDATCEELAPLAAMAAVEREIGPEGATFRVSPTASPGKETAASLSNLSRLRHQTTRGTIRNLRFFFAIKEEGVNVAIKEEGVNVMDPGGGEGVAIKEEGVEDTVRKDPPAEAVAQNAPPGGPGQGGAGQLGKSQAWSANGDGGSWTTVWRLAPPPELDEDGVRTVALDAEPVPAGCRFTGREAGEPELVRWALAMEPSIPWRPFAVFAAGAGAVIHLIQLSEDLAIGEPLAVEYLDTWGEPWLDVPSAEGVEVVAPKPEEVEGSAIELAAEHVLAGDLLCLCGRFSPLDAAASFTLGDVAAPVVSAQRRTVWLQVPAETPPGKRPVTALGIAGGGTTRVLRVLAELDQDQLFTGGGTTMRLRVEGTDRPIRIHLTNGSPEVIHIDGGDQQTTETSGGNPNLLERGVRATQRGNFDLHWKLDPPSCPCEGGEGAP